MLNTMTGNENKYHDLRPESQRKDENISETFAFVMKFVVETFIIKLHLFYKQSKI